MVGLIFALFVYFTNHRLNDQVKNKVIGLSEESILPDITDHYDELFEKVKELQDNPDQIAELNCMITKILYSGKPSDDQVKLLLKLQREYYTEQTLEKNPEDVNYLRLIKELKDFKEADLNIIGYKIVGPQYVDVQEGKKDMLIFNVIYYLNVTTDEGEIYKGYIYQQNEDKKWELKGFDDIKSFPIIY